MTRALQPFNVIYFAFTTTCSIIFENIISFNECNFRFTNIEAARTITSAFKSSIKILSFQQSQVFKYPKWKLQVDAWISLFNVSIN
jgi:hypothetical protein